jgi:endonuclease/exonuclease/phosphatase family metal-dependent hydrolase
MTSDPRFGEIGDGGRKSRGLTETEVEPPRTLSPLRVMTRNLCLGADLGPILLAEDDLALFKAVATSFEQARETDFLARAHAWADEIDLARPDLIGLQEVAIFRTEPKFQPGPPNASEVAADFLVLLQDQLQARNLRYDLLIEEYGQDIELPGGIFPNLVGIRLTHREVILVRTDTLTVLGKQGGKYRARREVNLGPSKQDLPWAWAAVDAEIDGQQFRFATTHLEPDDGDVQMEQAIEFLAGPGDTSLPIIWVGDFNSDAEGPPRYTNKPPSTPTYSYIIERGFLDAWKATNPGQPGFTCCQAADLRNPRSQLDTRVDLVLTKGPFRVDNAVLVGDQPGSGLWPSDHAGVVVTLAL